MEKMAIHFLFSDLIKLISSFLARDTIYKVLLEFSNASSNATTKLGCPSSSSYCVDF